MKLKMLKCVKQGIRLLLAAEIIIKLAIAYIYIFFLLFYIYQQNIFEVSIYYLN